MPQHFLYFTPLPHGHGSLRPISFGKSEGLHSLCDLGGCWQLDPAPQSGFVRKVPAPALS